MSEHSLVRGRDEDGLSTWHSGIVGETILWLHAYKMDGSLWGNLWSRLPLWRHIGVDLPGHGGSRDLRPGEDLVSLARSIAAIARKHGARRLVGLSFGGMVALQVAAEAPEQFSHLALGAPSLGSGSKGPGSWMSDLWMHHRLPEIFPGAFAARHPQNGLSDWQMQTLTERPQSVDVLRRIRAATLVLVGERDTGAFKRSAEFIHGAIRGCVREYVPDTGNLCLLESPVLVAPRLEKHFRLEERDSALCLPACEELGVGARAQNDTAPIFEHEERVAV